MINKLLTLSVFTLFLVITSCEKSKNDDNNNQPDNKSIIKFNDSITYGTMTDQEGNSYRTVKMGEQIWMAENLKTTKYRNGDTISYIKDSYSWCSASAGAYCFYNNAVGNKDTLGCLYNWYAASDPRNLAPAGWHVPTYNDFNKLKLFLSDSQYNNSTIHENNNRWAFDVAAPSNSTGFTALPSGLRYREGAFIAYGYGAAWWSSTREQICASCYNGGPFVSSYFLQTIDDYDTYVDLRYQIGDGDPDDVRIFGMAVRLVKD